MAKGVTSQGSVSSETSVSQGLQVKQTAEVLRKGMSGRGRETGFKVSAGKNFRSRRSKAALGLRKG